MAKIHGWVAAVSAKGRGVTNPRKAPSVGRAHAVGHPEKDRRRGGEGKVATTMVSGDTENSLHPHQRRRKLR